MVSVNPLVLIPVEIDVAPVPPLVEPLEDPAVVVVVAVGAVLIEYGLKTLILKVLDTAVFTVVDIVGVGITAVFDTAVL